MTQIVYKSRAIFNFAQCRFSAHKAVHARHESYLSRHAQDLRPVKGSYGKHSCSLAAKITKKCAAEGETKNTAGRIQFLGAGKKSWMMLTKGWRKKSFEQQKCCGNHIMK